MRKTNEHIAALQNECRKLEEKCHTLECAREQDAAYTNKLFEEKVKAFENEKA
jgi:hypothetical protein